jgi:stage V sporulation protein S
MMDRLFSKFQLGDLKVDDKSSFPPDAEPYANDEDQARQAADTQPAPAAPVTTREIAEPMTDTDDNIMADQPLTAEGEDQVIALNSRAHRPGYGHGTADSQGEILKVSSRSRPSAVAGAIAGVVRESGRAEVQAIGAGAANQAIKAVAIARDYLSETGIEAVCLPALVDLRIDDADRTAIRLVVETR